MERYKILVQVIIGENKGAGIRMGCRCMWDVQTDRMAKEEYVNVSVSALRRIYKASLLHFNAHFFLILTPLLGTNRTRYGPLPLRSECTYTRYLLETCVMEVHSW